MGDCGMGGDAEVWREGMKARETVTDDCGGIGKMREVVPVDVDAEEALL